MRAPLAPGQPLAKRWRIALCYIYRASELLGDCVLSNYSGQYIWRQSISGLLSRTTPRCCTASGFASCGIPLGNSRDCRLLLDPCHHTLYISFGFFGPMCMIVLCMKDRHQGCVAREYT